ncbi:MAG: hypothetical protein ACP5E3_14170, partial [Bacteroidales bacterium]
MSIQRYLEQLIEEIDEKMKIPSPASIRNNEGRSFFHEHDEIDEMMEFQGIPVSQYSKILKESLPPPAKLNPKQAGMLVGKISELLENWNFHLEYPESTPIKEKYRLIYDNWEEFEVPISGWHFHQDFCSGSCDDCEVKNWCETYNQDKNIVDSIDEDFEPEPLHMDIFPDKKQEINSDEDVPFTKAEISNILDSIQEKDFIPSVHNYCDRWCDRCSLKAKCSVFYFEKELLKIAANDDAGRSSFESVKHVFTLTNDILQENLKDNGIDFDLPFSTKDDFFPKIPAREQKVLDFAKEYAFSSAEWLKNFPEEKVVANHDLLEPMNVILY